MHIETRLRLTDDHAAVDRFTPSGPPDTELQWFFTMAESDMGSRSNFGPAIGQPHDDSPESRAQAARAHRTILEWLRQIGDPHAGVLQMAYQARPWPLPLREALGRVTGVVVHLGSAEAGPLPDDDAGRDELDLLTARRFAEALARGERASLAPLELRARVLLRAAVLAYEQARGGPARPVLHGVTS